MFDPSSPSRPDRVYGPHRPYGNVFCPACLSPNTQTKNLAKKLGGTLGTCAGVFGSLTNADKGAGIGAAITCWATASTMLLSSVTAAVLGALTGGAIGCVTGAALGQVVDETVLNNHLCLRCDHSSQTP